MTTYDVFREFASCHAADVSAYRADRDAARRRRAARARRDAARRQSTVLVVAADSPTRPAATRPDMLARAGAAIVRAFDAARVAAARHGLRRAARLFAAARDVVAADIA